MTNELFGGAMTVRNVNQALPTGLEMIQSHGVPVTVRDGLKCIRLPGPIMTVYERPEERVLFDPVRDANPFFHLFEALWILAGSNSLALPQYFLSRYSDYSDDGHTLHGAYGRRLRCWNGGKSFGAIDQLFAVIELLKNKPDTRQAVLSIWDPLQDLGANTKDMPCNDMVMLDIVDGRLNMTVCNRSNDVIWGAYGANVVQFSMLQEYIAICVGVERGRYVQMSNNYHIYEDNPFWQQYLLGNDMPTNLYEDQKGVEARSIALNELDASLLVADAKDLCERAECGDTLHDMPFRSSMGIETLTPALHGYSLYKSGLYADALVVLGDIAAPDWRVAMQSWVHRRALKKEQQA